MGQLGWAARRGGNALGADSDGDRGVACGKATLDTSYSHAVSGSFFHPVSIRQVSVNVTRFCSRVHARDRSASARLWT